MTEEQEILYEIAIGFFIGCCIVDTIAFVKTCNEVEDAARRQRNPLVIHLVGAKEVTPDDGLTIH